LSYAKLGKENSKDYYENISLLSDSLELFKAELISSKALEFNYIKNLVKMNKDESLAEINRELGDIFSASLYFQVSSKAQQVPKVTFQEQAFAYEFKRWFCCLKEPYLPE